MNLVSDLAQTPLRWTLEPSKNEMRPGSGRFVPTNLLTVVLSPGETPVLKHFRAQSDFTLEQMLVSVLREHQKDNPLLKKWYLSKGNGPVALEPNALESISECMHTALRKLADSKQSAITWNAIHHLHDSDSAELWKTAREAVTEAFAGPKAPSRRQVAQLLRDKVCERLNALSNERIKDDEGDLVERPRRYSFALLTMILGCELTELDEWMWGWLGYVVKDMDASSIDAKSLAEADA